MHQLQWKWKRITGPECQLLRGLATMLAASRRALHVLPRRVCRSAGSVRPNHAGPSADSNTKKTTHFGFKTVAEQEKQGMVKNVFDSVASNYDLMNDAMSLGVHRLWKDDFVSGLNPGKRGPMRCLDVAGGTGDIALRILDHAREKYADRETVVEVSDINAEMLKEGYRRFKKTMYHNSAFPLFEASAS
jgi:2-methoxy-6-polyprenyl-1,4-benzoquinol methylase